MMAKRKHIVLIGGGTGTSMVVSGLITKPVELTALVSVADSGGSTGRLRDEFGFQPVGDLRQSLAALAKEGSQEWIRKVLLYRFEKGKGLKGHNLGNLLLTALQDMAGSTAKALEIAEHIFRLRGRVLPVTDQTVDLVIEYEDGKVIVGEDNLNDGGVGARIKRVSLTPKARIYGGARDAILSTDMVIIGPGDYYASIMAALSVDGMKQAVHKTKAKIVYIVNLMTRANQTHGMTVKDHVRGIEQAIGRLCDVIVVNNGPISRTVLEAYKKEEEYPVVDDNGNDARYIISNIVARDTETQSKADVLHRSLLRHDPKKLAKIIMEMI